MKQLLCMAFFTLCVTRVSAQDVIVKKDGSTIPSKVLEVNTSDIKYKKFSNLDGPTYTINQSEIISINYENGEIDSFNSSSSNSNQIVYKEPDVRNLEIIRQYNYLNEPTKKIKKSNKTAKRCFVIVGVDESSLMSNDEVEITFEGLRKECGFTHILCYGIKILNKTNNIIYVDKSKCFRKSTDEPLYCYYNSMQNSINILPIPPHQSRYLTDEKWDGNKIIEGMERFRFKYVSSNDIGLHNSDIKLGQVQTFNYGDLPWSREYIISYSTDESYREYSFLMAKLYIRELMGCPNIQSFWGYRVGTDGLVEGELDYSKYVEGFNEYTIIGYHKIDDKTLAIHPSSYIQENLGRTAEQEEARSNAIVGATMNTVNSFLQGIQNSSYGNFLGTTNINWNDNSSGGSVISTSRKEVPCSTCGGEGFKESKLTASGKIRCGSCHGKGYVISYDSNSEGASSFSDSPTSSSSSSHQHDLCNGSGKCNTCNGTGEMWKGFGLSGKTKCPNCNGSGKCSGCNGTGRKN